MAVNRFPFPYVYKRLAFKQFPGLCYLCDRDLAASDHVLCRDCVSDLPMARESCPVCAMPGLSNTVCADCLNRKRLYLDRAVSAFRYEYPVSRMIIDFKFNACLSLAGCFAHTLLMQAIARRLTIPDIFMPVPLHRARLAGRGYNQSLLVARELSTMTGAPVDNRYCRRTRATRRQSGLSASERRRNLKGAFAAERGRRPPGHIAIVDDVVTTGTTVNELARVLTRAGAQRIDVWCCARAAP